MKHNSRSSLSYHNDNDEGFYENVQGNEDEVREKLLSVLYIYFKHLTRSSWLNCGLRDDETVYWVSIGHYEAVAFGNW